MEKISICFENWRSPEKKTPFRGQEKVITRGNTNSPKEVSSNPIYKRFILLLTPMAFCFHTPGTVISQFLSCYICFICPMKLKLEGKHKPLCPCPSIKLSTLLATQQVCQLLSCCFSTPKAPCYNYSMMLGLELQPNFCSGVH